MNIEVMKEIAADVDIPVTDYAGKSINGSFTFTQLNITAKDATATLTANVEAFCNKDDAAAISTTGTPNTVNLTKGSLFWFKVTITNAGTETATRVGFEAKAPEGITFEDVSYVSYQILTGGTTPKDNITGHKADLDGTYTIGAGEETTEPAKNDDLATTDILIAWIKAKVTAA